MTDWKCPFCGSKELKVKRKTQFGDEIELKKDGTYGAVEDFCCLAQRQNSKYRDSYAPDDKPDLEDIARWD